LPDELVEALRAAGCVFAEEEAVVLRGEARTRGHLELMLARRLRGEPLEQVVGWAEFCGLRVAVAPGVFVPRRRSELLVELAVAQLRGQQQRVVVDLCCGTGALGMVVADRLDPVDLHASDLDPAAVAVARRNLVGRPVHEGDLYDALPESLAARVDVLLVNAPYVPTEKIALMPPEAREHEHRVALDGGSDGLDLHRRVAAGAPRWLRPGGVLLLETSTAQAAGTRAACELAGLRSEVVAREETLSTVVRAVRAERDFGPGGTSGRMAR
jgi:release factor glutamine methyltransferase